MLPALLMLALQAAQAPDFAVLERAVATHLLAKDRDALETLLDEAFVMRGAPDRDRRAWIETAVTGCWGDRVEIDDPAVVFTSGDVALVTLNSTYFVDPATCEPAIVRSLISDTWRRGADGVWRLLMRHASAPGGLAAQFERLDAPPPPFEGRAHVSYMTTRGNTRTGSLAGGLDVTWRAGAWITTGALSGLRADADGEPKARKSAIALRAARRVGDRISLFARTGALRDRFAGVESQFTVNAGASLDVPLGAPHTLDIDLSTGYLDEDRVSGARKHSMTGDLGARYHARLSSSVAILDVAIATVDLQEPGDWRARNQLALDVSLRRWLSIELSHTFEYRRQPIEGFRGLDQSLSTSVVTRF